MKDRLKLYDTSIEVVLSSKLKKETKKIAFSNGMTMSAYIRMLIIFGNELYTNKIMRDKIKDSNNYIKKIFGGIME